MKILLLSVVVLFLAGAEGRSFWQQDEPQSGTGEQEMWKQSYAILEEVLSSMSYAEIAKQYHLEEKLENAKDNVERVEAVLKGYFQALKKKSHEMLEEKFPVFTRDVLPHLQTFDDKVEEGIKTALNKLFPAGSEFGTEVKNHLQIFADKLRTIGENARDELRKNFDELRSEILPHAEAVKKEYDQYKEDVKEGVGEKIRKFKKELTHQLEELSDKVNPVAQKVVANVGPYVHDAREKIQKVITELYHNIKRKVEHEEEKESA